MSRVYFKSVDSYSNLNAVNKAAASVLQELASAENLSLESFIPLKVHCGEKGNKTFIRPDNFNGIINYLEQQGVRSEFVETNALYRGERNTTNKHLKVAKEHGFTRLPLVIADGECGEEYELVEINKKHFQVCKIAKGLAKHEQVIVLSHFKGHTLAGFGGAVKQLGMGFAAKGGKLDQHANSIPKINPRKCRACKACVLKCPADAIILLKKAKIRKEKCIGCASCIGVCLHSAVSNSWLPSLSKSFFERLVEYAYAAAVNKKHIYINFALNITKACDCEGHHMKIVAKDIGLLASTDPVAIDQACLDLVNKNERKRLFKRGRYALEYAEKIGLGSRDYEFIDLI